MVATRVILGEEIGKQGRGGLFQTNQSYSCALEEQGRDCALMSFNLRSSCQWKNISY